MRFMFFLNTLFKHKKHFVISMQGNYSVEKHLVSFCIYVMSCAYDEMGNQTYSGALDKLIIIIFVNYNVFKKASR